MSEIKRKFDAAFERCDLDEMASIYKSKEFSEHIIDSAGEMVEQRVKLISKGSAGVALAAFSEVLVTRALMQVVTAKRRALEKRVDALESKLAEVSIMKYLGVHENGRVYERGEFVSHAGGMWHANRANKQRPGDGDAWTLAVKRGADGKDSRP